MSRYVVEEVRHNQALCDEDTCRREVEKGELMLFDTLAQRKFCHECAYLVLAVHSIEMNKWQDEMTEAAEKLNKHKTKAGK